MSEEIKKRYKEIAKSDWFKKAYNDMPIVESNEPICIDSDLMNKLLYEQLQSLQQENESLKMDNKNPWLSPIESERNRQEAILKEIWESYPDGVNWQYMNGLLSFFKQSQELQKENDTLKEWFRDEQNTNKMMVDSLESAGEAEINLIEQVSELKSQLDKKTEEEEELIKGVKTLVECYDTSINKEELVFVISGFRKLLSKHKQD